MDALFRPAVLADLPAIVALLADDVLGAAREKPDSPEYQRAFDAIGQDANQLLVVAHRGPQIVGCVQISFIPGLSRQGMWRGQLESVRIAATERGSGLGRAMIAWAIEQCRSRGCGLVQLTTDTSREDALRFYESLGFEASHAGLKLTLAA